MAQCDPLYLQKQTFADVNRMSQKANTSERGQAIACAPFPLLPSNSEVCRLHLLVAGQLRGGAVQDHLATFQHIGPLH